jgi:glycosyltransferase involved in cell wall biosynthesis
MIESIRTSVIIPAYNAERTLPLVLNSLILQDFSNFEVILVDDASQDQTANIAHEFASQLSLQIIQNRENQGRARARNLGIQKACGDILILLDSDIEVKPNFLSLHLSVHDQAKRVVGIGVMAYPPDLADRALARYYSQRGAAKLKPGQSVPGKYFISCNASLPRSLFNEVGGFDQDFRVYGGEDLEMGLRLEKNGARFEVLREAIGIHHHLRPLSQVIETVTTYGRTGLPLVLSHHPEFSRDVYLNDLYPKRSFYTSKSLIRRILTAGIIFYPLLWMALIFESIWLPAPLITYLHYRSFRFGLIQYLNLECHSENG